PFLCFFWVIGQPTTLGVAGTFSEHVLAILFLKPGPGDRVIPPTVPEQRKCQWSDIIRHTLNHFHLIAFTQEVFLLLPPKRRRPPDAHAVTAAQVVNLGHHDTARFGTEVQGGKGQRHAHSQANAAARRREQPREEAFHHHRAPGATEHGNSSMPLFFL